MGCGYHGGHGRWERKMERMQGKMDRFRERMTGHGPGFSFDAPSSGNRAFDEYRSETIPTPDRGLLPAADGVQIGEGGAGEVLLAPQSFVLLTELE